MKVVLIYDDGDEWTPDIKIKEFEDKDKMIEFVNNKKIGDCICGCYEVNKEIKIEPFETVLEYRVKD